MFRETKYSAAAAERSRDWTGSKKSIESQFRISHSLEDHKIKKGGSKLLSPLHLFSSHRAMLLALHDETKKAARETR